MTESEIVAKSAALCEREEFGKSMRKNVPRDVHAEWKFESARPEAIERIRQSFEGRIESLIALRNERMAVSPFAYFRGAALPMAFDLLRTPPTRLFVQLCGDAHLRNFGTFARFDGTIGFDINDFDETYRGPFEWDLKRLAASIVLAGREAKHDESSCKSAVRACVTTYQERVRDVSALSPFEILRKRADREEHRSVIGQLLAEAKQKSHQRLLEDLTETDETKRRFRECPPLVKRVGFAELPRFAEAMESYRSTLGPAMRTSLEAWRLIDVAFKVVGVGSVGLAAYAALLTTGNSEHYLMLQMKQARESVVELALRAAGLPTMPSGHQGQRVIEGQRAMQTHEDPLIGYTTLDGLPFMVRALAENKVAISASSVQGDGLAAYAKATGTLLAFSHSVTGDPVAISAYLGSSDAFANALARFATAYANQVEDDHRAFVASWK